MKRLRIRLASLLETQAIRIAMRSVLATSQTQDFTNAKHLSLGSTSLSNAQTLEKTNTICLNSEYMAESMCCQQL